MPVEEVVLVAADDAVVVAAGDGTDVAVAEDTEIIANKIMQGFFFCNFGKGP